MTTHSHYHYDDNYDASNRRHDDDDDDDDDDESNRSDNDDENNNNNNNNKHLKVNLVLRIHAANLPRYGVRKILPDTYASITTVGAEHNTDGDDNCGNGSEHIMRRVAWGRTEM
jgi:hypothetical protein